MIKKKYIPAGYDMVQLDIVLRTRTSYTRNNEANKQKVLLCSILLIENVAC